MARQSSSSSNSSQKTKRASSSSSGTRSKSSSSGKGSAKAASPAEKKAQKAAAEQAAAKDERVIDERARRDIAGIVLAVVAIALLVTAVMPAEGLVTSFLSSGLHLVFGVGSYILPFVLLVVGVSFLSRSDHAQPALRVALGLALIFIALLALLALFTPETSTELSDYLFAEENLVARGGYVGAGIAWAGLELLGKPVSCVILVGVILVGLAIVGVSVSQIADRVRAHRAEKEAKREAEAGKEPRIRRAKPEPGATAADAVVSEGDPAASQPTREMGPAEVSTQVLPQDEDLAEQTQIIPRTRNAKPTRRTRSSAKNTQAAPDAQPTQPLEPGLSAQPTQPFHSPSADAGQAGQPTQALQENPTRRLRPSDPGPSGVAAADAAASQPTQPLPNAQPAQTGRRKDPTAAEAAGGVVVTRKLGHKGGSSAASSTASAATAASAASAGVAAAAASAAAKASSPTPSAAPHPDEGFLLPPMSLLRASKGKPQGQASEEELSDMASCLQGTLEDFGIMAQVVGWDAGPTVTLFKVDLPAGVRVSRVTALQDDIALALASPGVRIYAPVPGTNYVGIEVPNRTRQTVLLGDVLKDAPAEGPLQVAIGVDVEGHSVVSDLAKMPHLLIGGTTGSGKSVSINAMIMSILMRATPSEVRFILIDPKRVEFTPYNGIPHLYVPVVTEPQEAASALAWAVAEMERRLKILSKAGARDIGQYNAKVQAEIAAQKKAVAAGKEPPAGELGAELPYLVIVIDELADLMMNVGKEVEFSISRLAQLARAAGIHLIVATQRPSTNVVTGLIKANITNRISFNVASSIDSRVILDTAGAENLIGLGDMLFSKPEYSKPRRIQGCYVSEEEINAVVAFLKEQAEPDYHSEILQTNLITLGASQPDGSGGSCEDEDPLLWEAADIVVSSGLGSTSNIQRRLKVGYSRAGRIMDMLEDKGIVGPPNGSKPREVLVDELELETLKAFEANDAAKAEG